MALRVLLADESSTIKRVFEISLKDLGLEIKTVQHGIDVIEVAESFQPDIIFADVLISKMNGYEVCAQIKQHPQLSVVPVVLMWSSFMEIDEDKYSACSADGRLEKPFSNEQLRAKIQSLVPRILDTATPTGVLQPKVGSPSPARKRKDPTEDLLFKDDLPMDLPTEEETPEPDFLDPQALDSSLNEELSGGFHSGSLHDDIEPEVTDVDLELNLSETDPDLDTPLSDFDEDSLGEDLGLDGFQALDITGSYDEDLNDRWAQSGPAEFGMGDVQDDEVPLDFTPPPSALDDQPDPQDDIIPEVTAVPSLEEEAELLQMAKEDTSIRNHMVYPHSEASSTSNATSVKHRSIDELTDSGLIDELSADGGNLPPVPQKPMHNDPKVITEILISKEELRALVHKEAKNMLQSVIWEVVPELAKQMIDKELKRLLAEDEPPQA